MPSIISATTTNGLVTSADNSGSLQLATNNGTAAVNINTAQGVSVLNCLGVGNATPSTSGAGITFPATQSASSDANTLDDYEEGTWSPVLNRVTGGAITASVTVDSATYVKIGKIVILSLSINPTSVTSQGSGSNYITGLPFLPLINFGSVGSVFRNTVFTTDVAVACAAWSDGKLYFHNTTNTDSEIAVAWKAGRLNFTLTYEA